MSDAEATPEVEEVEKTVDFIPNTQVEGIFENWNLKYKLEADFPIDKIQNVAGQQVRDQSNIANKQYVEEYLQQYTAGAKFPPIVLRSNGTLIDGNTRLAMWKKAKRKSVPVYLVELPSVDLARYLGTQLNQLGGVRLTPNESARQGLAMLEEGTFDDMQIARIVGRSRTQVGNWRKDRDFVARAEKTDVVEQGNRLVDSQRRSIVKVVQARPFAELVKFAASRKIQHADLAKIVENVLGAESEDAAVDIITAAGAEFMPTGPDGRAAVTNPKAKRMRMVLPQVLNLAPAEEFYDSERAEADRAMWIQISIAAKDALEMYSRYGASVELGGVDE
jgi:hypothetical protein